MRFSAYHVPLSLPITSAESVEALLAANQQAFADKFDEQASWLVEQDSLVGRADAIRYCSAAEVCGLLRDAIKAT
jgi:hypothetical protein